MSARRSKLPGWIWPVVALLIVFSFLLLAVVFLARSTRSPVPRLSIIPDMDNQPRYEAQDADPLRAGQHAMRPPVEGTLAQGQLAEDAHLNQGIVDGEWATRFPLTVTEELMARGRERFQIYCAPCHGLGGYGDGMINLRAEELREGTWVPPLSYHTDEVRARPVGHLFNTITGGIRTMPAYGPQIEVKDRWAIIAYLRALQRSQYATLKDVPEDIRRDLETSTKAELNEIETGGAPENPGEMP